MFRFDRVPGDGLEVESMRGVKDILKFWARTTRSTGTSAEYFQ